MCVQQQQPIRDLITCICSSGPQRERDVNELVAVAANKSFKCQQPESCTIKRRTCVSLVCHYLPLPFSTPCANNLAGNWVLECFVRRHGNHFLYFVYAHRISQYSCYSWIARETERGTDRYRQIQWDMPNHIEVQWADDHDRGEPFRPATPPSWWCVCLPIIFPFNYRGQIISPEHCCPDWIYLDAIRIEWIPFRVRSEALYLYAVQRELCLVTNKSLTFSVIYGY